MVEHLGSFNADRIKTIAAEVLRRTRARKDVVAPRGRLDVAALESGDLGLVVKGGEQGDQTYPIKRGALQQIASSLDVPLRYLERLTSKGHVDLAAANLGELVQAEAGDRRHLLRLLDDKLDAFLSDRFRSIGHDTVLAVCADRLKRAGAEIVDLRLTDTEFRLHAWAPHISGAVVTDRNFTGSYRWQGKAGDVLNAAISVGNSETGHGAFKVQPSILRHVCQNFCIWGDTVSRIHVGGKLAEGEQAFFSDATRRKEDEVILSKLRDVIDTTFNPAKFRAAIDAINATTTRTLGDSPITVVDASIREFGLPADRRDAILAELLGTGDVSQYGLVQAITSQVNPDHVGALGDDARNAFEDAGSVLLRLAETGWKRFLADAYKPRKEEVAEEKRQTVRLS